MKPIKVSEASGAVLDWMVAKCEGVTIYVKWIVTSPPLPYSTDWAQGGPIIERERIDLEGVWNVRGCGVRTSFKEWCATHPKNHGGLIRHYGYGPTALIAAMRCYAASKLGDTVEVPDEI